MKRQSYFKDKRRDTIFEQKYIPFGTRTDFAIYRDKKGHKFLRNDKLDYALYLKPGGHIPKTGLALAKVLERFNVKGLKVLDVGTGENAFLAIHAKNLGARSVYAIDPDSTAVRWGKLNLKLNKLSSKIFLKKIGIEEYKSKHNFDIIIANLPQMPVKVNRSLHDDGGFDGREYILKLIERAKNLLERKGILLFAAFDFLGIKNSYNPQKPTILKILKENGYRFSIALVLNKKVLPGSYTLKNLSHIKSVYPGYRFIKRGGTMMYKIFIIEAYY